MMDERRDPFTPPNLQQVPSQAQVSVPEDTKDVQDDLLNQNFLLLAQAVNNYSNALGTYLAI